MNRRTVITIVLGVLLLHVGGFLWLANKGIHKPALTPRGPEHFEHIAVRVEDKNGEKYIVRQYTVTTDLVDPTPQFVDEP